MTGIASKICGDTFCPWFEYETRSRLMNRFFIITRYRTGSGLSRPNWWRISAIVSGFGLRPASWRAGSTPGVAKKIRNTSTLIANITATMAIEAADDEAQHLLA